MLLMCTRERESERETIYEGLYDSGPDLEVPLSSELETNKTNPKA